MKTRPWMSYNMWKRARLLEGKTKETQQYNRMADILERDPKIYKCKECGKQFFEGYLPRYKGMGEGCCSLNSLEEIYKK